MVKRNYIDNIQITVSESVSIAERAPYYDRAGVLRDMFQSHILQLLAVVAMEPPSTFEADTLRNEKVKVLEAVRPISAQDAPYRARAGPVRRLSGRAGRSSRFPHRHLRRSALGRGQLALAGRPLLPALRQGAGQQEDRGADSVPPPAPT